MHYPLEIESVCSHRAMIVVESVKAGELVILARRKQIHVRSHSKSFHHLAKKPWVKLPIYMVAEATRQLVRPHVEAADAVTTASCGNSRCTFLGRD